MRHYFGDDELARVLINYMAQGSEKDTTLQQELKWEDRRGHTPLMLALDDEEFVSFKLVEALLEHAAPLTQTNAHKNDSILSLVIATDDTKILELVTRKAGIDIDNAVDAGNRTPLEVAAMFGSFQIATYLLERGAPVDVSFSPDNSANYTPLVTAIEGEDCEMARSCLSTMQTSSGLSVSLQASCKACEALHVQEK